MDSKTTLAAYAACFEALTPDRLETLSVLLSDEVRFRDPFSDVQGRQAVLGIFRHMFEAMEEPVFKVLDQAVGKQACYLKWRFSGRIKGAGRREIEITGMSEVTFDEKGLVASHIDHWDAASQVFGLFPVLGPLLRWLGRGFTPAK
ncbi:nuclear transport factor 2 family protein [Nisaea nitritireducens]|uniref:nuclear transport factor 2 family protein n=1 Tax=Nisaea nitritireducens TaxID=568392 RepID=UPI001866E24C|nr:nuclear transport factor 2 family protein [Nisaea nitritireducens]